MQGYNSVSIPGFRYLRRTAAVVPLRAPRTASRCGVQRRISTYVAQLRRRRICGNVLPASAAFLADFPNDIRIYMLADDFRTNRPLKSDR